MRRTPRFWHARVEEPAEGGEEARAALAGRRGRPRRGGDDARRYDPLPSGPRYSRKERQSPSTAQTSRSASWGSRPIPETEVTRAGSEVVRPSAHSSWTHTSAPAHAAKSPRSDARCPDSDTASTACRNAPRRSETEGGRRRWSMGGTLPLSGRSSPGPRSKPSRRTGAPGLSRGRDPGPARGGGACAREALARAARVGSRALDGASHAPRRRPRPRRDPARQDHAVVHVRDAGQRPLRVGPHEGARHVLGRGAGPALDAGTRQGVAHGRVRDAAREHPGPKAAPRVVGPGRRAHPRDPAPRRALAARDPRRDGARRAHALGRLRRPRGRRRDAHRVHQRRLHRGRRRAQAPPLRQAAPALAARGARRRDVGGHRQRGARPRPRLLRGPRRGRRHERRDDGLGEVRRGPGHRRGPPVRGRRARLALGTRAEGRRPRPLPREVGALGVTPAAAPRRIVLATTNRHKAREIAEILGPYGVTVEVPASLPPVDEDGETFAQNARKKAHSAARACGAPALAEDSGLVVDALSGEPGVRSARYAGPGASDEENVARLLREIASRGLVDPKAAFVCHAVLSSPEGDVLAEAAGRVEGVVRGPPRGRHGFGYDPVFHWFGDVTRKDGVRFSDLLPHEKDAVSHRGLAFRSIARALADLPPDAFERAPGVR